MREARPRVLVLCTGNSCRSQMAAGYLRHFAGERLAVDSAGTAPAGEIHPMARRVMAEDGLDLGGRRPQDYRRYLGAGRIDHLIVVCDGADLACPPAWPGVRRRHSWPFADPAALTGPDEEVLAGFRRVRDEIRDRVRRWLAEEGLAAASERSAVTP